MRRLVGTCAGLVLAAGRLAAQVAPPAALPAVPLLPVPVAPDAAPKAAPPSAGVPQPPAGLTPAGPPAMYHAADSDKPEFRDCHLGPCHRTWIGGGVLLWWVKDGSTPVLATSPGGVLGDSIDYGTFNGVRAEAGIWFDDRHVRGAYFGGFSLEQRSVASALAADGPITRPLFDVLTRTATGVIVADPGNFAGRIDLNTSSRLWGLDAGFVRNVAYCPASHTVDVFFGFRHLDLDETLQVRQETASLNGTLALAGDQVTSLRITDRFDARNQFYGGEIGVRAECRQGPAFVSGTARLALGPNHQTIGVFGRTDEVGGTRSAAGGLLALPGGNAGAQETNRFAVVPEVGVGVGCQLTCRVRASVGYDFLYVSDVARPGGQIDTTFNPRLVPASLTFGTQSGPAAPRATAFRDDFFAHGLRFQLDWRY